MQKMPIRKIILSLKNQSDSGNKQIKINFNLAPGGGTVISFVAIQ
jgi:hypothetical protein